MSELRVRPLSLFAGSILAGAAALIAVASACSSSNDSSPPPGGDGSIGLTCSAPGSATPGPADVHCQGQPAQPVDTASCNVTSDGGAPGEDCAYGDTEFGQSGTDDDCKYKVSWTSDPICEGAAGVQFTATVTNNVDGSPVTGTQDGLTIETYIPTNLDASCDDKSTHPSPGNAHLQEVTPGSGIYKGPIVFDAPGEWSVRFHIHEECTDILPTSQHGHIAFHVSVP